MNAPAQISPTPPPAWPRLATLKPRLRDHVLIHRHLYRGQPWYVLQDRSSTRLHRFNRSSYRLIQLMDGVRSMEDIWQECARRAEPDAGDVPTQEDLVQLFSKLHAADALHCDELANTSEQYTRHQRQRRAERLRRWLSPLALRIPLLNPRRLLDRGLPLVAPLFGTAGSVIWLALIVTASVTAVLYWSELTHDLGERVLSPHNLLVLALIYPLVKALHELGHAFAARVYGGEVHEIGIMLLALMPVPYVNASAAAAFKDKRQRMVVGAAGIMVEALLAALALFVWLAVEPGMVQDMAFNVMLIGGLSTVIFNGNPLLRFDGYYVFADAIEIPNLGPRSTQYLGYWLQRYVFGAQAARSPVQADGERAWFIAYGSASFIYRLFIIFAIIVFVAGQFLVIGVLLAIWAIIGQVLFPLIRTLTSLFKNPLILPQRRRVVSVLSGSGIALAVLLFALPVPYWTYAQGVVWLPEHAQVRAGGDGFIQRLLVEDGAWVTPGTALFELDDPLLHAQVRRLEAEQREVQARYDAALLNDRVQTQILKERLERAGAELATARERLTQRLVRSPVAGRFIVPRAQFLPGRYARQGEVLGYVAEELAPIVRAVIPQADAALVRENTTAVKVKVPGRLGITVAAQVQREVPAASDRLPTAALGASSGGLIPVQADDELGLKTVDGVFQFDLALPSDSPPAPLGSRVYLRFEHGTATLASQWYRALRQLLLSQFDV